MGEQAERGLPGSVKFALAGAAAVAAASYWVRSQRRVDFSGKRVLLAGASRGLGLELARVFATEGARLILLARHDEELAESKRELEQLGTAVMAVPCDVSNEREVHGTVARVVSEVGAIDILVNVAGIIQVGPSEHMSVEDYANAMKVHFWGPLYLIQAIVPIMRQQRSGRIVNITSIGGKIAVPHLAPYVASKFALVGLSEAMRAELVKDGIYVTTVVPGLMRTGSHINALFKGQQENEFALFSVANAWFSTSSQSAARQIVQACRYGKAEIVITPQARVARLVSCLFPNLTAELLAVVTRVLPGPRGTEGDQLKRGWQSRSWRAPRFLTQAADRAIAPNREKPQSGTN
jgi:short-subunit dehydrogenase